MQKRLRQTSRIVTVAGVCAAVLLAGLTLSDTAHADMPTPGAAGMAPTVVSHAGGDTLFVWGNGLGDPSTRVEFYCPYPPLFQPQATSQASVKPFATGTSGDWIAIRTPSLASLGNADCMLGVSNSAHTGTGTILVGGAASGSWAPTLKLAAAGQLPSVGAASPNSVLAAFNTAKPPVVQIAAQSGIDLGGATAQQILCANNRAGTFATTNAATPTASLMSIYPVSLPANGQNPNYCAILVTLGAGTYSGRTVLVPGTAPSTSGAGLGTMFALEYKPPYTGPIRVRIVNTTGVADSEIYVSIMGNTANGGAASGFPGVNTANLVTQPLVGLVNIVGKKTYDNQTHSAYFEVTNGIDSGDIYISKSTTVPGAAPSTIGNGSPPSPLSSQFRYALAEFTYDQNLYSDLTLIDQIGFSMSSALYTDDAGTSLLPGSNRSTGCLNTLVDGLERILPPSAWSFANPDGTGGVLRQDANGVVIGYVGAAKKPGLYMTPQVQTYVTYVQTLSPLTISDMHNAADQPGEFDYTATFANGVWTLNGTIQAGATAGPTLLVESASLSGAGTHGGTGYALYGEDGPFDVQIPTTGGGSTDYGWGNGGQVSGTSYQDLVKTIYRDFIAAFAYGYWGSRYPQPSVAGVTSGTSTGKVAAYFTLNPRTHAYANAGTPAASASWNAYDQLVRLMSSGDGGASGAYGTAYSDTFLADELSPAIGTNNARLWNIVLGDPPHCAQLKPSPQTLLLSPDQAVTVLAPGVRAASGVTNDFVPLTPLRFAGPVTYTITPKLPTGMTFDKQTGVIAGTPVAASPRTTYPITGTDGRSTATAYTTITVGDYSVTPSVQNISGAVSTSIANATPAPATYALGSAWQASTVEFAVSPALPGSLSMNSSTGVITGTLPSPASIAAPYTVSITDNDGGNATVYVWLTVMGAILPRTQTVVGVMNKPIMPTAAFTIRGFGTAGITYSVVGSNTLPTGLAINSSTGVISGTPKQLQTSEPITIQATSTAGTIALATVTVAVALTAPPSMAPSPSSAPAPQPSPAATPTPSPSPTTPTPTAAPTPTTAPTPTPSPTPTCPPGSLWDPQIDACVTPA